MALVQGTPTIGYTGTTTAPVTISHTVTAGSDRHLVCVINVAGDTNGSTVSATYNSTSMTKFSSSFPSAGFYYKSVIFDLDDPDTGANDLVISFSPYAYTNKLSWYICDWSNCSGILQKKSPTFTNSPPLQGSFDSDVTAGSTILLAGCGANTLTNIECPQGTALTLAQGPNDSEMSSGFAAEYGLALKESVSAGSLNFELNQGNTGGFDFAVLAAAEIGATADVPTGGGRRRIIIT